MKIYRIANLAILSLVLSIAFATAAGAADNAVPEWNPAVLRDARTIKTMTTEPDAGEHWSNLWVVVIDGSHTSGLRSLIRTNSEEHNQALREVEGG